MEKSWVVIFGFFCVNKVDKYNKSHDCITTIMASWSKKAPILFSLCYLYFWIREILVWRYR